MHVLCPQGIVKGMEDFVDKINKFFTNLLTPKNLVTMVWFIVTLAVLFFVFYFLRKVVNRVTEKKCNAQIRHLIDKAIYYTGLIVITLTIFNRLGISFSALLGAAGIFGVAIGFAAQTSVSNIISGVFVMAERAFKIGDFLQVDTIFGIVESIDLLSVKLRTTENQLVRIPNETIIKTNLINITHYPVRRCTIKLGVAYGTDLEKLRVVLLDIAEHNEFSIADPAPLILFDAFGDSSINIVFGVWTETPKFLDLKNSLMIELPRRFATEKIEIPFTQVDVRFPDKSA